MPAIPLIDGLHVPLAVPFARDGRLFLAKLERNVARYSLSPAAGLVALAAQTEAAALSDAETLDVMECVAATAREEKVLVAGIARNSVAQALTLAALAARSGFDAVLLSAPPCWPQLLRASGPAALVEFFRTVADNSPLPVLLASDSATPSLGLSPETTGRLALHANIIGLYDAALTPQRCRAMLDATREKQQEAAVTTTFRPVTRRMERSTADESAATAFVPAASLASGQGPASVAALAPARKTRSKKLGFQIMACGNGATMLDLLQAGAAGAMPPLAAPAPQSCHEVLAAYQDGNPALAAERAARLEAAGALLERMGPSAASYACDLNGYYGGTPRLPRLPLDHEARARVSEAMRLLRN